MIFCFVQVWRHERKRTCSNLLEGEHRLVVILDNQVSTQASIGLPLNDSPEAAFGTESGRVAKKKTPIAVARITMAQPKCLLRMLKRV